MNKFSNKKEFYFHLQYYKPEKNSFRKHSIERFVKSNQRSFCPISFEKDEDMMYKGALDILDNLSRQEYLALSFDLLVEIRASLPN